MATCVNQVDGVLDMVLPLCGSVWERAQKGDNGHCLTTRVLSWRKLSLPLALMPDTSVSPYMLLVPFQLLPQPSLVFTARSYRNLPSWHWNPRLGSLVWGWDPLFMRYPYRFLSTTCGCGTTPSESLHLLPSYPSG